MQQQNIYYKACLISYCGDNYNGWQRQKNAVGVQNIIENTLDIMFYSKELKIGQAILPKENVRSRMQLLNASIIFYALDKLNYLKPDTQIYNSTNFIISCLYNAITEYYTDSDLQYKIDYGYG